MTSEIGSREGVVKMRPVSSSAPAPDRRRRGPLPSWAGLPIAVAVISAVGAVTASSFVTSANLDAVLLNASLVGITAVAMTQMALSGNFISLAASQSGMLAAVAFAAMIGAGWNVALAIVTTIALLAGLGVLQGVVVAAGLNPVLTTIAAGAIIFGVTSNLLGGQDATLGSHQISWSDRAVLGLQIPVYVFVLFTLAVAILVHRTVLGRQIVLSGANRRTAELSGISTTRVTLWVFLIFGVGVAIAGVLQAAQVGTTNTDTLATLTVDAGAAVLIGGTAMSGGFGSPVRSAAGAVIITLANNVMILNNVSYGLRQTVVGAVVIVVVVGLEAGRRRVAT